MPKYAAYVNTSGYLPDDSEPAVFDTASEAWEYLADQRMYAEDSFYLDSEAPYSKTVDALNAHAKSAFPFTGTVYGATPGRSSHAQDTAYTVDTVED